MDILPRKPRWTHRETTGVPAVAFAPDGRTVAVGVYRRAARLLDAADGTVKATFEHPREVRAVASAPVRGIAPPGRRVPRVA